MVNPMRIYPTWKPLPGGSNSTYGKRNYISAFSRRMSDVISSFDGVIEKDEKATSQSVVVPRNFELISGVDKTREKTPDVAYAVGESTLETLPGTVTPPIPVYSPKEKLTESCISVASTPTTLDCNMRDNDDAMLELRQFLSRDTNGIRKKRQKVCFIASDGENVDGKGNPINHVLTKSELKRRRKKHMKIIRTRKRMWQNYQKAKSLTCTNKVEIMIKGIVINLKRNEGDLL